MKETEQGVVLIKDGDEVEVTAPFQLESAKFGMVHYVGAPKSRRYQLMIKTLHLR